MACSSPAKHSIHMTPSIELYFVAFTDFVCKINFQHLSLIQIYRQTVQILTFQSKFVVIFTEIRISCFPLLVYKESGFAEGPCSQPGNGCRDMNSVCAQGICKCNPGYFAREGQCCKYYAIRIHSTFQSPSFHWGM